MKSANSDMDLKEKKLERKKMMRRNALIPFSPHFCEIQEFAKTERGRRFFESLSDDENELNLSKSINNNR